MSGKLKSACDLVEKRLRQLAGYNQLTLTFEPTDEVSIVTLDGNGWAESSLYELIKSQEDS